MHFPNGRGVGLGVTVVGLMLACSSSDETSPGNTTGGSNTGGQASVGGAGTSAGGTQGSSGNAGTTAGGQAGAAVGGSGGTGGAAGGATGGGGAGGAAGGTTGGGGAGGAAGGASGGGAGGAGGDGGGGAGGTAAFELTSTAFAEGAVVPLQYKCSQEGNNPAGMNQSPPLSWGPGPEGTLSYAIILRHLPNPDHWVIWDIPAVAGMGVTLPEDIDHDPEPADVPGAKQSYVDGLDGFTGSGYLGPCPQATNSEQTYEFALYALDVATLPGIDTTSSPGEAAAVVKANMVDGSEAVLLTGKQTRVP